MVVVFLIQNIHESVNNCFQIAVTEKRTRNEIDFLIESSKEIAGWYGGRIMGGGFGGNTINLIKKGHEDDYINMIGDAYQKKYNIVPNSYLIKFDDGVEIIDNISAD